MTIQENDLQPLPRKHQRHLSDRDIAILKALLKEPPAAAGIAGSRWSPARLNQVLNAQFGVFYSARHAVRLLRQRGLQLSFVRARESRLGPPEIAELSGLLQQAPTEVGVQADCWTRRRIAQLIERRFGVRYSPQYLSRLMRASKVKVSVARRERRMRHAQIHELREILKGTPQSVGLQGETWTHSKIARLIARRFSVHYHTHSIRRFLQRWHIESPIEHGGRARLNAEQIAQLRQALTEIPHAAGIEGNIWTQRRIALLIEKCFGVRYRAYTMNRVLARIGITPAHHARQGGSAALNSHQVQQLAQALQDTPAAAGYKGSIWRRKDIAAFIRDRFHARYAPASIPRLLRRNGLRSSDAAVPSAHPSHPQALQPAPQ